MTRDEKIRVSALKFVKNPTWWGRAWFRLRWQLDPPEDIMEWVVHFSDPGFWDAEEEAGFKDSMLRNEEALYSHR